MRALKPMNFLATEVVTPEGVKITYCPNGLWMFGFKAASQNKFIDDLLFRYYEEVATRVKYLKIKPGDIMLDVGASIGSWTIPAAIQGAQVYAFEIGGPQISALKLNMQLNNLTEDQINVQFIALCSDDNMELVWDGKMTLHKKGIKIKGSKDIPVGSISLDTWVNQHRDELPKIDYIKIDVEGMELEVLRGAYYSLREFRPKLIIEIHEAESNHLRHDVESLLGELKYKHKKVHPLHDYFY